MIELLEQGGWMMYPLLAISIVALGVIIERVYTILIRTRPVDRDSLRQLFALIEARKDGDARTLLKQHSNSFAPVLGSILNEPDEAHQEKAAGYAGDELLFGLQRRLSILSAVGTLAPLMGLLGTVLGMIEVFGEVAALGETGDASVLAGGIWEALLTTAAGMSIAIPALAVYHYLHRHIAELAHTLQHDAGALIALLSKRTVGRNEQ